MPLRGSGRDAGFTVLELAVSMAVVGIAMALAGRLLLESQLGLVRARAELSNPLPRYASTRLRRDLEQASSVPALVPGWRSSPLQVVCADGSRVVWRHDLAAETLERLVLDATGGVAVRQVVLRDVAELRWRAAAVALVDVELVYRVRDTSRQPLAEARRTWSPPTVERSTWLRAGLRAAVGPP